MTYMYMYELLQSIAFTFVHIQYANITINKKYYLTSW